MNIQKIKDTDYIYCPKDAIRVAKAAERLAYMRGDKELSEAYDFIIKLLKTIMEK